MHSIAFTLLFMLSTFSSVKQTESIKSPSDSGISIEKGIYTTIEEISLINDTKVSYLIDNESINAIHVNLNEGLLFAKDESLLSERSKIWLAEFAEIINKNPSCEIVLIGHTDNSGEFELNQKLSLIRALSVKNYLIARKVSPSHFLKINGRNYEDPVKPNRTLDGKASNRRVDIFIAIKKDKLNFSSYSVGAKKTCKIIPMEELKDNLSDNIVFLSSISEDNKTICNDTTTAQNESWKNLDKRNGSTIIKELPENIKKILEQSVKQTTTSHNIDIEIDGLLVDDTKTRAGKDFYDLFYDGWEAPTESRNFTITISEKPFRLTSTLIVVVINDNVVYQAILQPRNDIIEAQTADAIITTQNYLQNYEEITKQLNGEDLTGSGIY